MDKNACADQREMETAVAKQRKVLDEIGTIYAAAAQLGLTAKAGPAKREADDGEAKAGETGRQLVEADKAERQDERQSETILHLEGAASPVDISREDLHAAAVMLSFLRGVVSFDQSSLSYAADYACKDEAEASYTINDICATARLGTAVAAMGMEMKVMLAKNHPELGYDYFMVSKRESAGFVTFLPATLHLAADIFEMVESTNRRRRR